MAVSPTRARRLKRTKTLLGHEISIILILAVIAGSPAARLSAPLMQVFGLARGVLNGVIDMLMSDIGPEGIDVGLGQSTDRIVFEARRPS